jgi:hypothetical protein
MNFKNLLAQSLWVRPNPGNFYSITHNWCDVDTNVFGVNDLRPRIGTFTTPWNFQTPNMFPVLDCSKTQDKTIYELLDQRAVDLFALAQQRGKKIVVLWSGGIDSTVVLSAFIKNLKPADRANIVVCCNTESINENPYFYHTQISGRLEMLHLLDLNVNNDFLNRHMLLTGDPGDLLVGPSTIKYRSLIVDGRNMLPWQDNVDLLYQVYQNDQKPNFARWWVDKVTNNLREVQAQGLFDRVTTISDWHWWQYYNLKYNGTFVRPFTKHKKNLKEVVSQENIKEHFDDNFFGHMDFQQWSYTNLHRLLANSVKGHKQEFRDYILELDGNHDYHANKVKYASWGFKNLNLGVMFMDQDCVMYKYDEPGVQEAIVECMNNYRG